MADRKNVRDPARKRDVLLAAEIAQRLLPLHPARQRSVLDEVRRTLGCE